MRRVPTTFLWGASTSPHQVEGANVSSDWWQLENAGIAPERSGDAVDHYHRYPEDMRLLADAGLSAYRFGIEWSRIEPERGVVLYAQLQHYRRMIETALELGLTPVVTLHHFTSPQWFMDAGGWHASDAISAWTKYVELACTILDGVDWVCTINEPNILVLMSQLQSTGGTSPTIEPSLAATLDKQLAARLCEAHDAARTVLRRNTQARVGWTVAQQAFTPTPGNEKIFQETTWDWEDFYLAATGDDDFVGVQAYTSRPVDEFGPVPHPKGPDSTITGWAYRPDALGIALRHAHDLTGKPLLVTENGIATADDARRIEYTREALRHLLVAIENGVDVRGYLHWSALDNYEWGNWAPTFGLISVDRTTFERHPKPSLAWLGQTAREGARNIPHGSLSFAPPETPDAGSAPTLLNRESRLGDIIRDPAGLAALKAETPDLLLHPQLTMAMELTLSKLAPLVGDALNENTISRLEQRMQSANPS